MKATASRNLPGRYKAFIPGPLRVNPTLAWKLKTITEVTSSNIGRTLKKGAKAEDSRMGISQPRNALEKMGAMNGSMKGAMKKSTETTAPATNVFHAYLRVYSIDEIFE